MRHRTYGALWGFMEVMACEMGEVKPMLNTENQTT
jgi:hypothetical protein